MNLLFKFPAFTLTLALTLSSCDSPPEDGTRKPQTDTTKQPKDITMSDSALRKSEFDQQGFQNFLNVYKDKPLGYLHDTMEDVCGEGFKERVHTDIQPEGESFLVHNQIWRGKELIWSDTLVIDPGICMTWFWGNDTLGVIKYKPWSYFYSAWLLRNFTEPFELPYDNSISLFQSSKPDSLYWVKEVNRYAGKLVAKGIGDQDMFIWDRRCHQFVLYAP
ncbi:MAG TPA: hypothetical protein VNZ86_13010 [Bacteroidia bacterium]|jgi:hypothetical protein|nr:hypothetical protein [Bacteroidia bacterium]